MYTRIGRAFLKLISDVASTMVMCKDEQIRTKLAMALADAAATAEQALKDEGR